jgi:hypothetical protein
MTERMAKIKDLISRFVNVISNLLESMAQDSNPRGDDFWFGY